MRLNPPLACRAYLGSFERTDDTRATKQPWERGSDASNAGWQVFNKTPSRKSIINNIQPAVSTSIGKLEARLTGILNIWTDSTRLSCRRPVTMSLKSHAKDRLQ